jgi:hypothetical protein
VNEEVVILSQVLTHEVNMGYQTMTDAQITHVNKELIVNLKHFKTVVDKAVKAFLDGKAAAESDATPAVTGEGEVEKEASSASVHLSLDLKDGRVVVLDIAAALAVHDELLEQNRVPSDRSSDLADTPEATIVQEDGDVADNAEA